MTNLTVLVVVRFVQTVAFMNLRSSLRYNSPRRLAIYCIYFHIGLQFFSLVSNSSIASADPKEDAREAIGILQTVAARQITLEASFLKDPYLVNRYGSFAAFVAYNKSNPPRNPRSDIAHWITAGQELASQYERAQELFERNIVYPFHYPVFDGTTDVWAPGTFIQVITTMGGLGVIATGIFHLSLSEMEIGAGVIASQVPILLGLTLSAEAVGSFNSKRNERLKVEFHGRGLDFDGHFKQEFWEELVRMQNEGILVLPNPEFNSRFIGTDAGVLQPGRSPRLYRNSADANAQPKSHRDGIWLICADLLKF